MGPPGRRSVRGASPCVTHTGPVTTAGDNPLFRSARTHDAVGRTWHVTSIFQSLMLAVPGWYTLVRSSGTVHSLSRSRYRAGSRSRDHSGRGGGDRSLSRSQYRSGSRSRDRSRRGAGRRARCTGRGGGGWAAAQLRPAMRTGASEKGSRPQDEARPFWGSPLSQSGPRAEGSCTLFFKAPFSFSRLHSYF